jgi:HJR/Mrr/RecB family endonuclease
LHSFPAAKPDWQHIEGRDQSVQSAYAPRIRPPKPAPEFFDKAYRLWGPIIVVAAAVAVFITILVAVLAERRRMRKATIQKSSAAIKQHLPSLVRRRQQLDRKDPYGKPLLDQWIKEVMYFMTQHVEPCLTPRERRHFAKERANIAGLIHAWVEHEREQNPAFLAFSDDMTANQFEAFCAEQLRHVGWDAHVTKQSRDQGVDVVAEKDGIRVVLQCKLYSRPVGNKAVQEIAAARMHERANYGVVVSNHKYTPDAEQLASTNNILLIHYTDLPKLSEIIGLRSNSAEAVPELKADNRRVRRVRAA